MYEWRPGKLRYPEGVRRTVHGVTLDGEVHAVAERVGERLSSSTWDTRALAQSPGDVSAAAEVALFALNLAGKRRQARRGGRFGRIIASFALAACVALAACDKPNANPEATAVAISELGSDSAASVTISAQPRAGPAQFTDLVLLDAGSDAQPWAVVQPQSGSEAPVLVDRVGAGLDGVGNIYRLAAQPVAVGTRDGPSQFLDPLQPATSTGSEPQATALAAKDNLVQMWSQDERYLAATRAIAGQPSVLDAAYNAAAAATAGGTHTYLNGVVLRVEPDKPVLQVIDRALLESGKPTRAEDVVYVAIRDAERSLYDPGQVVNLRDVVMTKQDTEVDGQKTTLYVTNAALDGARVEPTGRVDLQSLLQPRLQRVDQDLAAQNLGAASGTPGITLSGAATPAPAGTATPGAAAPAPQQVIVQQNRGPSFIDDFLIFMWLSNSGFYRGPSVFINNPPFSANRGGGPIYYSPPPTSGSSPSTVASSQAASRSTALEAARSSVSGQAAGTGGGVAATNKSAADTTSRVGAATAKSASVASEVSSSSVGKSTASAPSSSSSTASRSAGSTSAGSRGSAGVSSSGGGSSGGKGISGSSGGGFGGKGISGGSSSS
jgi:hypothetical protein